MHDTYADFVLNIRQKYVEETVQEAFENQGGNFYEGTELVNFLLDVEDPDFDDYAGTATVKDISHESQRQISFKYILGADGTRSTVRKLAGIPFVGDSTGMKWFRIDAVIKTDMPDHRSGLLSIESEAHGNVLWMALDHGRTRIGFALPQKLFEKYGTDLTEEQAKEEAKKALAPFKLEFEHVDWWTLYSVSHRVAETFRAHRRVILVGDACHCHSSGTGQGMNTGVHDAVNLSWKLGGVLKGWYDDSILDTYEIERKPEAQRVIDNDKTVSALITGRIPEGMGSPDANPNELLQTFLDSINRFSIGLAIHYKPSILNQHSHVGRVPSGHRGPDLLLARPGTRTPVRLYQITKNFGKFYAIVFSGNSALTIVGLRKLRRYLDSNESFARTFPDMVNFITIIPGDAPSADEYLGVKRFGPAFYDTNLAATRYGFSPAAGGIVILRPDGIVGFSAQLEEGPEIGTYFKRFVNIQSERKTFTTKFSKKVPETGMKEVEFDMETARSF
ncbi:Monooxygenase, FAD-binding [Penicillium occitanis (nom. inval.)]|nr:hypothetical protein PENOC_058300 [Penicillium occitanis (nom. inval.)]PCH07330.1 Monooxygenase, FAD-binding [Penicillium occitanis (nom. inval.)]